MIQFDKFRLQTEMARAKDLRSSGLLQATSYDDVMNILYGMNPKQEVIGEGWFSVVFGDDGPLIVKITNSDYDGCYDYLELARSRYAQNRHYPMVAHLKAFTRGTGYLSVMEKLDFSPSSIHYAWKTAEWYGQDSDLAFRDLMFWCFEYYEDGSEKFEKFLSIHPNMESIFDDIMKHTVFEESGDLHMGNVAARARGQEPNPVIVDPVGNSYLANYNK